MENNHIEVPANIKRKELIKTWVIVAIAALLSFGLYNVLPYDENANKGLSLLLFIGILWLTEAVHITITALLVPVLAVILGMPVENASKVLEPIQHQQGIGDFCRSCYFPVLWWFCFSDCTAHSETGS